VAEVLLAVATVLEPHHGHLSTGVVEAAAFRDMRGDEPFDHREMPPVVRPPHAVTRRYW